MMYQVYTHVTIKSCKQLKVSKISILPIVKHKVMLDDFFFLRISSLHNLES